MLKIESISTFRIQKEKTNPSLVERHFLLLTGLLDKEKLLICSIDLLTLPPHFSFLETSLMLPKNSISSHSYMSSLPLQLMLKFHFFCNNTKRWNLKEENRLWGLNSLKWNNCCCKRMCLAPACPLSHLLSSLLMS